MSFDYFDYTFVLSIDNAKEYQFIMKDKKINKLKKELLKIAPQLEERDRMEAALNVKVSFASVNRYLKGEVKKVTVGEDLCNFFNSKLKQADIA